MATTPLGLIAAYLFLSLIFVTSTNAGIVERRTDQGTFIGTGDETMETFLGIPFAQPPVGSLRWRPPQKPNPSTQVFNATIYRPMCMQTVPPEYESQISEDCLYLNIWNPDPKRMDFIPVMVFLHGGAFVTGSGILYDGRDLALAGRVLVITANYRLGAFGFYASKALLNESKTTGNYAMQDQRMLISWIRNYIGVWGGNPNMITIFGESAGGVSACHHMVSDKTYGKFHRAIIQSGICHALPLEDVIKEVSVPFTQRLNCSNAPDDALLLQCLRDLPAKAVLEAQNAMARPGPAVYLPWFPVIDGYELTQHPYDIIRSGNYIPVPVLIGVDRDDFSSFMCPFYNETATFDQVSRVLCGIFGADFLPNILAQYHPQDYKYPVQWAIDALTDSVFKCPSATVADLVTTSRHMDVYLYSFEHDPGFNRFNKECFRVSHAFELPFLFPEMLNWIAPGYKLTPQEQQLSMAMMKSWTSFAWEIDADTSHADPSNPMMKWVQWTAQDRSYNILDTPLQPPKNGFRADYCRIWPDA